MILKFLCNTPCSQLGEKDELAKKEVVTFGGVVTSVKAKFSKNGSPCGFVTIEDFNGPGEIALFGEEWGKWRGMLLESSTVYITAKSVPRFRGANTYDLRITNIQYMNTVKENSIQKLTIVIDENNVNSQVVTDLTTLVDECPGNTSLYLQIKDAEGNGNVLLRSKGKKVELKHKLIQYIEETDGFDYYVN